MSGSEIEETINTDVTVDRRGAVCTISFNRPGKLNALTAEMHSELLRVLTDIETDDQVRSVLLRGEGQCFTAGGDFDWFLAQQRDRELMDKSMHDGRLLLEKLIRYRVPIVAAIQGAAVGLGASLGILADIVVMTDDAFYRDPHVALGLVPGDGGLAWPASTGMQIAKQYVLLGDRLPASEALRLGMVNEVVSRAELDETAFTYAKRLADLSPKVVQATKRAFNLQLDRQLLGISDFALAAEHLSALDPDFAAKVAKMTAGRSE